ncbi:MAG: cupin domain-containing protein [Oscillospiraceae bacterium]|nr:cupin domain-containing protein [Oscillospiraceae bacterium]
MFDNMNELGARLRELREVCGFSAEEVAENLNISAAVYAGYEQNAADIPISVLYHVAVLCKVDLNELLTGVASHIDTLSVVRRGQGLSVDRYAGYRFENLAFTFRGKMMEPLLVTVEPSDADPEPVTHGGQEFNMVLEGVIELLFDGRRVRLEEGDCAYFDPGHPHGQRAVGQRARFLTVIAE